MRRGIVRVEGRRQRSTQVLIGWLAVLIVLGAMTVPLGAVSTTSLLSARAQDAPVPYGDVIITLNTRSVDPSAFAAAEQVQVRRVYRHAVVGFAARLTEAQARRLARHPRIRSISPDLPVSVADQVLPTGVDRVDADANPVAQIDGNDSRIDADVAVLDTGVDLSSPDLNIAGGVDCDGPDTGNYGDAMGHGTHIAGTIAALDNGIGVVGVAPGARIWSVRVLDANGNGTTSGLICGLDWVAAHADTIDVVNMSLAGAGADGSCSSTALHEAVCNVVNAGVPIIAAAGNGATDASATTPATYAEVIAVSAFTDLDGQPRPGATGPLDCTSPGSDDVFAPYSNYGPDVDIAAPGTSIKSLAIGGSLSTRTGTSMAAAHVSGAVALYKSVNPGASPAAVRSWLLSAASRPQNAAVGFCGDPDGYHEPVLFLGNVTIPTPTPSLTATPSPASTLPPAEAYQIAGSSRSGNSLYSTLVWDRNMSTVWQTNASSPPNSAWVYVDLGAAKPIGKVRWVFGVKGIADYWRIQVSNDKQSWTTLGVRRNKPVGEWQELVTDVTARYVRFYFTNPNRDPQIGGLAEVEVWPSTTGSTGTAPTPTATPTFTPTPMPTPEGTPYAITGSSRSGNSGYSTLVWDKDPNTVWTTTTGQVENSAWVSVDIGAIQPVGAIRWLFGQAGLADAMRIQVSSDRSTWTTVAQPNNAPAGVWQALTLNGINARYVRWFFNNPLGKTTIGGLAEVEVWPPAGVSPSEHATATPAATEAPGLTETPQPADEASPAGSATPSAEPEETIEPTEETQTPGPTATPEATAEPSSTPMPTLLTPEPMTETPADDTIQGAELATPEPYAVSLVEPPAERELDLLVDGNLEHVWQVQLTAPGDELSVVVDLGAPVPVGTLQWLAPAIDPSDAVRIETGLTPDEWTLLWEGGINPDLEWQTQPAGVTCRFIRLTFTDSSGDGVVGGIAEVRVMP